MPRIFLLPLLLMLVACGEPRSEAEQHQAWCAYYGKECPTGPDDQSWWDSFYGRGDKDEDGEKDKDEKAWNSFYGAGGKTDDDSDKEEKPWNSFYGNSGDKKDDDKQGWW